MKTHTIALNAMLLAAAVTCRWAAGGDTLLIDGFDYADAAAAQAEWKPAETTLPVGVIDHVTPLGAKAMRLPCDFTNQSSRSYWDRYVTLNLSQFNRFTFMLYVENPDALQWATLYFESQGGWYSGVYPVRFAGWQRISISRSDFTTELQPMGWDKIRRIRLSFWKGSDIDTDAAIDDLQAVNDDIVVVFGDNTIRAGSSESQGVREYHAGMICLLSEAGVPAGSIADSDIEAGALAGRRLAIFAYSPDISDAEAAAVEQFVHAGGKIIVFYTMPMRMAELLGLSNPQWTRERHPGEFASIRFNQDAAPGLPESILQGSYNIWMYTLGVGAVSAGTWVDTDGQDGGIPAVILHSNGCFMGHVLMPGDADAKRQMLLSIIGALLADKRGEIAAAAIEQAGTLSGFPDFASVSDFVRSNAATLPEARKQEVLALLDGAGSLLETARGLDPEQDYGEVMRLVCQAGSQVLDAFMGSFSAPASEFRGLWCHSPLGVRGWSWDQAAKAARDAGFTALVPNMLWAGCAAFDSEYQPMSEDARAHGDQVAACLAACRAHGLQMHVWKVNWCLWWASDQFVQQMRAASRLQKDRNGNEVSWLCPSDPDNFELEKNAMLEVVHKYAVDGIHFDYIRYPDASSCYCAGCKARFEQAAGVTVANWPAGVITGAQHDAFAQWRQDQITRLVRAVSQEARAIRPGVKISAAVFWNYPDCMNNEGQDWKLWIDEGLVDFLCPMSYTDSLPTFKLRTSQHLAIANGRIPVYPGIGASSPGLRPEQVALQIKAARDLGAPGFMIFQYDLASALSLLPELAKGPTRPPSWPIPADTNGDCRVNILDLIFIRNKLSQPVAVGDNWKADVNQDTRINILDLIFVRNKLNTQCP